MRTLAVVRAVVFVLLAAYALYAMPWKYMDLVFFPRSGVLLGTGDVLSALRTLVVALWLAVAWIGIDAYLGFSLGRRAREKEGGSRPPEAAR
jgi:hypothetical protein